MEILIENQRLTRQLDFLIEIDKLKSIQRHALLANGSRLENSAEHSWHLAVMALILSEYADEGLDVDQVVRLLLAHDIIEIDAGDTFAYDVQGNLDKAEREKLAANRLFGLLPDDQAAEFHALWDEFEARATAEARFAHAMDRLMPLLHNYLNEGAAWKKNRVSIEQIRQRTAAIPESSGALGRFVETLLAASLERGFIGQR